MKEAEVLRLKADLKRRAKKLHPNDEEGQNRYIFGTLNKIKERSK